MCICMNVVGGGCDEWFLLLQVVPHYTWRQKKKLVAGANRHSLGGGILSFERIP